MDPDILLNYRMTRVTPLSHLAEYLFVNRIPFVCVVHGLRLIITWAIIMCFTLFSFPVFLSVIHFHAMIGLILYSTALFMSLIMVLVAE